MRPLFECFSGLKERIPHQSLAELPTPVEEMAALTARAGAEAVYVKRDDQSGRLYGGNKVRKLEFLLGAALAEKRPAVVTFGAAGSNHALATAIYAREVGLRAVLMLGPQHPTPRVCRNLLRDFVAEAEMHDVPFEPGPTGGRLAEVFRRYKAASGAYPLVIPPGGSSPVGALGFVNAGFELAEQVRQGVLKEPDVVYCASGTMGTCVGLVLGLHAAGLRTRVEAVRVTPPPFTWEPRAPMLFSEMNRILLQADPEFPRFDYPEGKITFRHEFFGEGYGVDSKAGTAAEAFAEETHGLHLEGTYTAKTFAAALADADAGRLKAHTALFWNTYNGVDFTPAIQDVDYRRLPAPFHRYFTAQNT